MIAIGHRVVENVVSIDPQRSVSDMIDTVASMIGYGAPADQYVVSSLNLDRDLMLMQVLL